MRNINIGINGFGRIGKCIFLQLIENSSINIKAININNLSIDNFQEYINNDSIHYTKNYVVNKLNDDYIEVNNKQIKIFREKNPEKITWKQENVDYLFETSGIFLTTEKAKLHDVNYLIMSAPPKDIGTTPIYCYGVNENKYKGENIISAASCTTNCIAPMLNFLDKFNIENGNFITVHSATASQSIVDTANFKKRTNRSIFNNIIPHTTGASDSLDIILPNLKGKIIGTSVRIPVSNVSMIDLNVQFNQKIDKKKIINDIEKIKDDVITTNNDKLVSSDFISNTTPTILDTNSTIQLTDKSIKFTLWYDNEWSYSAQMIRLAKYMFLYNENSNLNKINNVNCKDKTVFVRCDYNCPVESGNIQDDFRIISSLKTLSKIIIDKPEKIIIATHFGRPKKQEKEFSTKIFIPYLEKYLNKEIIFLPNGLDSSQNEIQNKGIYLMENVRFHDYETDRTIEKKINLNIDIFCNESFSCSHRDHKSITGIESKIHTYGYCFAKEIDALNIINNSPGSNIIAIIGGSKMEDKIPMMRNLSHQISYIYITGNNINNIKEYQNFFDEIKNNKAEIIFTQDGFNRKGQNNIYIEKIEQDKICDIGPKSLNTLFKYIEKSDIVFWNGTLGITEDSFFKNGSENLVNTLNKSNAKVIIGGGDTTGFVNKYDNNFYHISTGGGASIDYLSNGTLPGLKY
jgi:glyceraldehyde 3-phosphate dehydrogenase